MWNNKTIQAYLLFFLISGSNEGIGQDLFDYTNTLKYSNYLYELRQFDLVIPEFERLIYFDRYDTIIQAKLYKSYWASAKNQEGLESGRAMYLKPEQIPANVVPQICRLLYKNQQLDSAIEFLNFSSRLESKEKAGHMASLYSLNADWKAARSWSEKLTHIEFVRIKLLIDQSSKLNYKSKGLAAFMSGIIPGAGKFYTGNWKDGIFSLLFVGATSYQSYRGFNNKGLESLQGWLFGGMAFGFYTGNIAGSYQSAYQYNKKLDKELIDKIEQEYFR